MALCRAIYSNPDVALLDDVFSALDASTARAVFESLFVKEKKGMLCNAGTILVTHALHLLPSADLIVIMKDGSPAFLGSWDELQQMKHSDQLSSAIKDALVDNNDDKKHGTGKLHRDGASEEDGIIMTVEEREYGVASFRIWVLWFKNAGGWPFFISQMVLLALDRGFYVTSDWYV